MAERYEIRIRGRLSPALAESFEGLKMSVEPVETILHGDVVDQAALYGLLDRLQGLGLALVEVRRMAPDDPEVSPEAPGA